MQEAKLRGLLDTLDRRIELDCSYVTINCDAPKGMVWKASGNPTLCGYIPSIASASKAAIQSFIRLAYDDIWERASMGLEACVDKDCELCNTTD